MVINVANAIKEPGNYYPIMLQEEWQDMEFNGDELHFTGPLQLEGTYTYTGESILIKGEIKVPIQQKCYRCLEPFYQEFSTKFREEFGKSEDAEAYDCYYFSGDHITLDDMIKDNILLNIPMANVCSENCKGLCPSCGTNLNIGECLCEPVNEMEGHHPLAVLKTLLADDDKEV